MIPKANNPDILTVSTITAIRNAGLSDVQGQNQVFWPLKNCKLKQINNATEFYFLYIYIVMEPKECSRAEELV